MKADNHEKIIDAREDKNVNAYFRAFNAEKRNDPISAQRIAEGEILFHTVDFNSHRENTPVGRMYVKALKIIIETAPLTLNTQEQRDETIQSLYVAEAVSQLLGVKNSKVWDGIEKAKEFVRLENVRVNIAALKTLNA